jgi:hypothetical protein
MLPPKEKLAIINLMVPYLHQQFLRKLLIERGNKPSTIEQLSAVDLDANEFLVSVNSRLQRCWPSMTPRRRYLVLCKVVDGTPLYQLWSIRA